MKVTTSAHDQRLTLHIIEHVQAHDPRSTDPHYHLFEQAKTRIKKAGLWRCALNDDYCGGQPELHHVHVPFAQQNASDFHKVNAALGLHIQSDDEFAEWIEQPGNLEVLCVNHHRTHFGVHVLPAALWEPLRYLRSGIQPGAEFVPAKDWGKP
jgi:hypothetical protein